MNLKMPELAACLEDLGFTRVKTILSSGNAVFDSGKFPEKDLVSRIEKGMQSRLGKVFPTYIRSISALQKILASPPYPDLPAGTKKVVTFLAQKPGSGLALPITMENATLYAIRGMEAYCAYLPDPGNPAFMKLLEKTFGKDITTRTWETLEKIARAGT